MYTSIHDTSIKAPLAGYVTVLNVSAGEMGSNGMNLTTLTDLKNMWVVVNIDETELSKFKENQKLEVSTLAYAGKTFEGTGSKSTKIWIMQ